MVAAVYGMAFESLWQDQWMARLRDRVLERGDAHLLFPPLHVLKRDGGCLGEEARLMEATAEVKEAREEHEISD